MNSALRHAALRVSRYCGVQKLFRLASRGPAVLFYHGVEDKIVDPDVQGLHMPLREFERQIDFLCRHREFISIEDLEQCIANRYPLDPRHVLLTFDDGYLNNARIVAPLLSARKIPFVVFVSTRHISEHCRFGTYYVRAAIHHTRNRAAHFPSIQQSFDLTTRANRMAAERCLTAQVKKTPQDIAGLIIADCLKLLPPDLWPELNARFSSDEPMSWEDVRFISRSGGTIGSHCHDHCVLHAGQPEEVVQRQLDLSKEMIERQVGECRYFAYPNGTVADVSAIAHSAARRAGYKLCFSSIEGEITGDSDCYLAPRFWAIPDYEEFCYMLSQTGRENHVYYETCRTRQGYQSPSEMEKDQPVENSVAQQ